MVAESDDPLDRLHRFAVEYYRMCRLKLKGQPPSGRRRPMVEFAQQLLTSHPEEAAHAFAPLVVLLEDLLDDAAAAGALRPGLDHGRIAGVVLQATMFNAFAAAISGSSSGSTPTPNPRPSGTSCCAASARPHRLQLVAICNASVPFRHLLPWGYPVRGDAC